MQDQVDEVAGEEMFSQMALWIDEKVEKIRKRKRPDRSTGQKVLTELEGGSGETL